MEHIVNMPDDKGAVNIFKLNENTPPGQENEKKNFLDLSCTVQLKNLIKTNVKLCKLNDLRSIVLF